MSNSSSEKSVGAAKPAIAATPSALESAGANFAASFPQEHATRSSATSSDAPSLVASATASLPPDSADGTAASSQDRGMRFSVTSPQVCEKHPLEPFLPPNARILMLGSFPPPRRRWSMEFFYPNPQNDMWRIVGYLATGDKTHFIVPGERRFDRDRIAAFCAERGIALYDTAVEVIRLKDNASDDLLQVVHEVDLAALLARIPACCDIVTTGGKATETLRAITGCDEPPIGGFAEFHYAGRAMRLWRMPSSSRAYPKPVEWKAEFYRVMFSSCGII